MLVDKTQLHENHLYKLVNEIKNTAELLSEFLKYNPAVASAYLYNMIGTIIYVQKTIESGLEQAQNQKLSHTLFPNDVLVKIKEKIEQTAQKITSYSMLLKLLIFFKFPFLMFTNQETKQIHFYSMCHL